MSVSYSISNCDNHIRLDVSGEYSDGKDAVEAKDIWRQVADACREHGQTRVLAVSGIVGEMPTMVSFSDYSNSDNKFRHSRKSVGGWKHRIYLYRYNNWKPVDL